MTSASRRLLSERIRESQRLTVVSNSSSVFSEEPVDLDTFIHDSAYLNRSSLRLGEHQYDLIRHMEQIYLPEMYPYLVENCGEYWNPVRFVNFLNVQWGKGSGKDLSIQIAVSRIAYLLLCLQDPVSYYGLAEGISEIHILNLAMNAQQAKRAFFRPLGNLLRSAPWFADKLRSDITDQATHIYLDKQIELISGHSLAPNFEGLSPIAVVLDEISGFQSDEQKASRGVVESERSAEATYDTVRTSASTRFPHTFKVAAISFPRYLHDPIQNLCREAREDIEKRGLDNSTYYVSGPLATWDVNPRYAPDQIEYVTIPEADVPIPKVYTVDYEKDAAVARAKYECRPERAANRFMRNDTALAEAFPKQEDNWIPPVEIMYYWGIDTAGDKAEDSGELSYVPGWQVAYTFSPSLQPMEGAIYGIHVDLAVSGDRAGISMCHVKNWERREHKRGSDPTRENADYQPDDRPIVKVDFVTYYAADMQAKDGDNVIRPREIQLRWARDLVRELKRRGFTIGLVTFDSYQSVESIQALNNVYGIEADTLSVDKNIKPYANLREVIYGNQLEGYYDELLLIELESLNLLPNDKIDHPPGGSKDMADALCGAVTNAIQLGGDEGEDPEIVNVDDFDLFEIGSPWGAVDNFWGNLDFSQPQITSNYWN